MKDLNTQLLIARAQLEGSKIQIEQLQLAIQRVSAERDFLRKEAESMAEVLATYPGALAKLKNKPAAG